jgi:hypothetical protein
VKGLHERAGGRRRGGETREKQTQNHRGRDAVPTRRFSSKRCGRGRIAYRGIDVRSRKRKAHEVDGDGRLNVAKDGATRLLGIGLRSPWTARKSGMRVYDVSESTGA